MTMRANRVPWPERFWEKTRPAPSGCIEWTGAASAEGYGAVWIPGGPVRRAHRVAWWIAFGRWPSMGLDHACRNPRCVNVAHLREATPKENSANGTEALQTRCLRGHPFDAANTYYRKDGIGVRQCRACHAIRQSSYRRRA
jgi:hypothetical protein